MEYLGTFLDDWVEAFSQEEDASAQIKDEDLILVGAESEDSDGDDFRSDYVPSWERPELKNFETFCDN